MRHFVIALLLSFISGGMLSAHQFTPTYPKLEPAYIDGVLVAKMSLFNKRNDVEYYEIQVFDVNWNPIEFGVSENIVHVSYLETKKIDVYIRESDRKKATYICTRSKLQAEKKTQSLVSSRICSKIK